MTVLELRELLENYPEDMEVIAEYKGEYFEPSLQRNQFIEDTEVYYPSIGQTKLYPKDKDFLEL